MPDGEDQHVTRLLDAAASGDAGATEQLLPLVYQELRSLASAQLAREPAGLTLQPTALVHEAYLRLIGSREIQWQGRRQFFGAAATAMRRILVDRARRVRAQKHGGGRRREGLDAADAQAATLAPPTPAPGDEPVDLLRLNAALEKLEAHDDRQAEVVLLRYFAGLSIEETARAIGVSEATVKTDWVYARAWLRRELTLAGEG